MECVDGRLSFHAHGSHTSLADGMYRQPDGLQQNNRVGRVEQRVGISEGKERRRRQFWIDAADRRSARPVGPRFSPIGSVGTRGGGAPRRRELESGVSPCGLVGWGTPGDYNVKRWSNPLAPATRLTSLPYDRHWARRLIAADRPSRATRWCGLHPSEPGLRRFARANQ